jgi:hypothetical protein
MDELGRITGKPSSQPVLSISQYGGTISGYFAYKPGAEDREELLKLMENALREAMTISRESVAASNRHRYATALIAVQIAFEKMGIHRTARFWLLELAEGLQELDHGIVRPLLTPRPSGNRTVDPVNIWRARAYICMAADLMVDAGAKKDPTFRWLAESLEYLRHDLSRNGKNWGKHTIENWYRAFNNGTVSAISARELYASRIEVARQAYAECPEQFRQQPQGWLAAQAIQEAILYTVSTSDLTGSEWQKVAKTPSVSNLPKLHPSQKSPYKDALGVRS